MQTILQNPLFVPLAVTVVIIAVFPLVAGYLTLVERKVLADFQVRLGPMRVGPHGLLQPIADALKLMLKEDIIPTDADQSIFWMAPVISTFTALTSFAVLPFSQFLYVADVNVGILVILAMSAVGILGIILGGWSSNSHYPLLGALRSAAQLVSYEVALSFALLSGLMVAGTLSMQGIVKAQAERGVWFAFSNYGFMLVPFIVYLISATAETNRAPFDLPEAESELVAGFHTEYSGFRWALYFLAEYANMFVAASVAVTLFWGGWLRPFPSVHLARAHQLRVAVSIIFRFGRVHVPSGEEAARSAPAESARCRRTYADPGWVRLRDTPGQSSGHRRVLVPVQSGADHLPAGVVPRHLPALPLRPAHEHRMEVHDPDRHGRGACECAARDDLENYRPGLIGAL